MSPLHRLLKQCIIAVVFFAILGSIIGGIYILIKPEESCIDGIKNQNEQDTDCGGVCEACIIPFVPDSITIEYSVFLKADDENLYSVLASLRNSNVNHGVREFSYRWELVDASGVAVAEKRGKAFILPKSNRFLVDHIRINPGSTLPTEIKLEIEDPQWIELRDYVIPAFSVINEKFELTPDNPLGSARFIGEVSNDSSFDFSRIQINVMLYDAGGRLIGVGSTETDTVLSREKRFFQIIWSAPIRGKVHQVKTEAFTNVFNNENFLKRYGIEGGYLDFEER